jgi:hypothetical protein
MTNCNAICCFSGLWVGWPGVHLTDEDQIPESDPSDATPTAGLKSNQVLPVNLDNDEYEVTTNSDTLSPVFPGGGKFSHFFTFFKALLQWLLQCNFLATFPLDAGSSHF